jgi:hypothetical protein
LDYFTSKVKKEDGPMYAYDKKKREVTPNNTLLGKKTKEQDAAFTSKVKKEDGPMYAYDKKKREVRENTGLFGSKREPEMKDTFAVKGKEKEHRDQKYNSKSGQLKKNRGFYNLFGLLKEKDREKDKTRKKKKKELDLFGRPMF